MRPSGRKPDQLREIQFSRHFTKYAPGAVLVAYGNTKVICTATINNTVPRFLKGKKQGWLTAEYSMLPGATHCRTEREATRGKQSGRTQEIQRLIGRSLRAAIDLTQIGENTINIDCDVIQADGGTRTAAITGSCIALIDALNYMKSKEIIKSEPLLHYIASVSVGLYQGEVLLDLDYQEDAAADTDLNIVMNETNHFIEVQGTAENGSFSRATLDTMLNFAQEGIKTLIAKQQQAVNQQ